MRGCYLTLNDTHCAEYMTDLKYGVIRYYMAFDVVLGTSNRQFKLVYIYL